MVPIDLLISSPHFLTMEGDGVGYKPDYAMAVDRGKIIALGPREDIAASYQANRHIRAEHHVVLPGFIDAHMHTSECVLRGLAQDTGNWMMYGLGPFVSQLDEDAGRLGTFSSSVP